MSNDTSTKLLYAPTTKFSFAQARRLIGDLNRPDPRIYWIDFLVSVLTGHLAIHLILLLPKHFPDSQLALVGSCVCYFITVLAYMRAVMFIHELVHLPSGEFKGFRFAWNALCGIPLLIPSFLYYPHVDHHRRKHYGTEHDGEYLALSHHSRWLIVGFVAQAVVIPFLGIARFLLISPLCWLVPGARRWVHCHASTMLVDPSYQRNDAGPSLMRTVVLQEIFCFLWISWFLIRHYVWTGQWFDPFWIVGYGVALGLLTLNEIRTLGAHRWTNKDGEMTFEEQLLDTVNYPNTPWISELWGPVGTRFHALHHLFPRLPYHNLAKAHAILSAELPHDSPYHRTTAKSLTSEIVALWNRAGAAEQKNPAINFLKQVFRRS